MNDTQSPENLSRRELRKRLIRMRMEMNRQQIRGEALKITQPVRNLSQMAKQIPPTGNLLWFLGSSLGLSLFSRKSRIRPLVRFGLILAPVIGTLIGRRGRQESAPDKAV